MLGNSPVFAMIAVSDLARGKAFYQNILGLKQTDENPGGVTYTSGGHRVFVYQAPSAGKNEATSATWEVDDIVSIVKALRDKGVVFEHYDLPGASLEGDVHVMGGMKAAWFRDPDGNVLGLSQMS